MRKYLIRNIPEPLWRDVKATAALRGISIRQLIIDLLAQMVGRP